MDEIDRAGDIRIDDPPGLRSAATARKERVSASHSAGGAWSFPFGAESPPASTEPSGKSRRSSGLIEPISAWIT